MEQRSTNIGTNTSRVDTDSAGTGTIDGNMGTNTSANIDAREDVTGDGNTNTRTNSINTNNKENEGKEASIVEEIQRLEQEISVIGNSPDAIRLKATEISIRNQQIQEMELEIRELRRELESQNKEEQEQDEEEAKGEKNKEKKPTCAAFIRGDCRFGWRGKECQYDHPKVCVHHERTGYKCEGCEKHHPEDCHSFRQYKLCFQPNCLKNHRKWKDFKPEHLPRVPQGGGWDGKNWRTPSMKLLKEWEERDKGMGSGGGRGGAGNMGGMGRGRGGEGRGGLGSNQNQNRGRGYGTTGPPGDRNQYQGGHRMLGHTSGRGGIGGT